MARMAWGIALALAATVPAAAQEELSLEEPKAPVKAVVEKPKVPAAPQGRLEKYLNVRHPRILITPERLALIREQIKVPGSHFQQAHAGMVKRSQGDPMKVWGGDIRKGYWPVYASRELAFLSLVDEDPAERKRYAAMAAKVLPDLNYIQWYGFKSKSLAHAMATFGVALTYDWAYNEWTDADRQKAEVILEYFKKHWEDYHRVSEEPDKVSGYNFYGVLFGAQIMMHLAAGAEKTDPRFPLCADILARHLAEVGGELGAHNEGIGYTEYPMGFALPAAIALAQHGETRPLEAAKTHAFWTLNMYVQTFMTSYARKFVQYGVSHCSNGNEGFASLVLGLCPPERMPYYLWFYDRHMGVLSKAEEERRFDSHRGNTPFTLMLYPASAVAKDPTGVLPKAVADRDGYIFFRNRWQDENDIQIGLLNPVRRSGGWSQNEYLNLRLMAFDTRFLGGPGKQRGVENYTTLLVDGCNGGKGGTPGFVPGRIAAFEPDANGGYAIMDAGDYYRSMGVTNVSRHLLVRFSDPARNTAILSTLDDITSGAEHQYTWQGNLGAEGMVAPPPATETAGTAGQPGAAKKSGPSLPSVTLESDTADGTGLVLGEPVVKAAGKQTGKATAVSGKAGKTAAKSGGGDAEEESGGGGAAGASGKPDDDGIVSTSFTEAGRPAFLLRGRNGAVKGWVLHPADATITTGDPFRIETKGRDCRIWVVLRVAGGTDGPKAEIRGTGMDSVLSVDGRKVSFNGTRVVCE